MTSHELTEKLLSMPLADRVDLAQDLWRSIDADLRTNDEEGTIREALRRDEALTSGTSQGRTHEEVMENARRAIQCD